MTNDRRPCSLRELSLYFLKLGATGFGGPVALVGYMERDLVEERRWFAADDFKQGLALSKLCPGPLATQLAMYLGFSRGGVTGATAVAFAFLLPSFAMVVALAEAYLRFGGLHWMNAVFYGVGSGVIAIIARAAVRLTRSSVGSKRLLWALYLVMAAATAAGAESLGALFFLCGLISLFAYAPPRWSLRAAAPLELFAYFGKAGLTVFGSGLAIVPFLYGGVVDRHHWLSAAQFRDAVAVAIVTPGPVVITVAFIGYLVAGLPGACAAGAGVFLPVYLFVVLLAPWFKRHGDNPRLKAFVEGVTAAAIGALTGAVFVLARSAIQDVPAAAIAAAVLAASAGLNIPEPLLVLASGAAGLLLYKG